jgi:hypothetical protein
MRADAAGKIELAIDLSGAARMSLDANQQFQTDLTSPSSPTSTWSPLSLAPALAIPAYAQIAEHTQ